MNKKLDTERELWDKIKHLREEMVRVASEKDLDFLDQEVLSLSQELNRVLNEYEKLLHEQ
ncbi:hypothetical protein QE429_000500 [Bacillus sp. SORGH_AS 510]|uniref:aspartyl-phosphate phosphatase Spo0E family protein n=1 Tax=Bacillus sp. SORGH_AS_0510 TaxID=3041771 RepID=UPI00278452B0|nr:aspartyl-phosphate phosphatase Spo0E family protein [Bacillus sp. SORGH_AS_0510]MDQ1143673.1 hypothetical protein [Bacillus sp. SORGH_AS_0510]